MLLLSSPLAAMYETGVCCDCADACLSEMTLHLQVAIKFLERGAGIGRGVLREVLNHR